MEKSVVNSFQNKPTQKSFTLTDICFNATKKFNLNQENYIFFYSFMFVLWQKFEKIFNNKYWGKNKIQPCEKRKIAIVSRIKHNKDKEYKDKKYCFYFALYCCILKWLFVITQNK